MRRSATSSTRRTDGAPMLLKREVIATGDQLTKATSTHQARKARRSTSRSMRAAATSMLRTTRAERRQAHGGGLHREAAARPASVDGQKVDARRHHREGHQRGHHPRRVRPTVPDHRPAAGEARDLALLLRSGSLPAPIDAGRGAARSARASARRTSDKGVARARHRHAGGVRVHGDLLPASSAWWPTWCCWRTWCC